MSNPATRGRCPACQGFIRIPREDGAPPPQDDAIAALVSAVQEAEHRTEDDSAPPPPPPSHSEPSFEDLELTPSVKDPSEETDIIGAVVDIEGEIPDGENAAAPLDRFTSPPASRRSHRNLVAVWVFIATAAIILLAIVAIIYLFPQGT